MRKPVTIVAKSDYLDPSNCNSKLSYKIGTRRNYRNGRIYGSVILSDCEREIEWYFYDTLDPIAKIDKALGMLQDFRKEYIAAQTAAKAKRRRASKRTK